MVKPITPGEAIQEAKVCIPDGVIEAFNKCIVNSLQGNYASFTQEEVVSLARELMELEDDETFDYRWLNIESLFKDYGWDVEYDKPAYNESYPITFTFRKKKRR